MQAVKAAHQPLSAGYAVSMPLPRSESRLSASKAMLDGVAWCVALYVAAWVRLDLHFGLIPKIAVLWFLATAAAGQILIGYGVGLYRMKWMYGSFDEVASLARTALLNTVVLVAINSRLNERYVPMSATLAGGVIAFVLMGSSRYGVRLLRERWLRPDPRDPDIVRTLVFGAGEAGAQMIRAMLRDPSSRYVPVGLIDDDPAKRRLSIHGVPVLGTRRDIPTIATSMNASSMLIAAPSVESDVVRELSALAESLDPPLRVKVLPPVNQLLEQHLRVSDIRDVSEEDLLGRHQIRTDIPAIAGYLRGRRVLVTGAGGSIGSELCRQIKLFSPAALIMLDRDESALHAVQLSIEGKALLDSPNLVLADIRDVERLNAMFELHRPEVVFHAAALKHLTLLEQNPGEALKSNIWGTLNVLEAAAAAGVDRFVNISTDKAANPISVLGYSKRTAERLTAHVARIVPRASYLSVRFGNVLGSRGSVLTAFRSQIESGGPVTVTDRDVTREEVKRQLAERGTLFAVNRFFSGFSRFKIRICRSFVPNEVDYASCRGTPSS